MLTAGIVGLPNVGKSTLFNALTAGHAAVSNYPFTTIDSNMGMAVVPDDRLARLAAALDPAECTPCTIEFFDIAGLVEGASNGEGLGNQFLAAIRAVDAVVHVLRCFQGGEVAHVLGDPDPVRDAGLVETELLLADLEVLEKAIEKRRRSWKADPKKFVKEEERLDRYYRTLSDGVPLRTLDLDRAARRELKSLGLLTGKPVVYVANVGEDDASAVAVELARALEERAGSGVAAAVVPVSAKIEWELGQLEHEEREEFVRELGLEAEGLARLTDVVFEHLGLIRFYTLANLRLQAWEIERGTLAPQAAGKVHSEMEAGFVRAEVAGWDEVIEHGSFQELHRLGKLRTEGKSYEIHDGDVVEFLFTP